MKDLTQLEKYYLDGSEFYWNAILKNLAKDRTYYGPKQAWEFDYDGMSGTFFFANEKKGLALYATPFWEGEEGIPYCLSDDYGEVLEAGCLPKIEITGDSKVDREAYIEAVFDLIVTWGLAV